MSQLEHVRRVIDAIEAVIERRATKDQKSYSIDGRSLERTPIDELLLLRDRYRAEWQRLLASPQTDRPVSQIRFATSKGV